MASFQLQGDQQGLHVLCSGHLPDNLAEGREVVVEGRLHDGGVLRGGKRRVATSLNSGGSIPGYRLPTNGMDVPTGQ